MMIMGDKLPPESLPMVRDTLIRSVMTYDQLMVVYAQMKDPTIALILSILCGYLGVDRFYIGDTGMGIGKLLTCGGAYIWWLIDIFLVMGATRDKNLERLLLVANRDPRWA